MEALACSFSLIVDEYIHVLKWDHVDHQWEAVIEELYRTSLIHTYFHIIIMFFILLCDLELDEICMLIQHSFDTFYVMDLPCTVVLVAFRAMWYFYRCNNKKYICLCTQLFMYTCRIVTLISKVKWIKWLSTIGVTVDMNIS